MVMSDSPTESIVLVVIKADTNLKPLHYRACNLERNAKCLERVKQCMHSLNRVAIKILNEMTIISNSFQLCS